MACAASPNNTARDSAAHGQHFTVTMLPVGFSRNCDSRSGRSASASGNCAEKNARTSSGAFSVSKDGRPEKRRKRVQVKLPSRLGSAISMKSRRGQMCSACFSSQKLPPGPAGRVNSL